MSLPSEPQITEPKSHSWRNSPWLTLLIFIVIAHFNPEVLTGSTQIEKYFTFTNLLGMAFYGLQVAIVADLMARYRLRWRTVYLIGLIYGIFEEGFAVQTMLSPSPPGFVNVFRILGLNVTWAIYIAIFHAVVSVLSSILIMIDLAGARLGGFLAHETLHCSGSNLGHHLLILHQVRDRGVCPRGERTPHTPYHMPLPGAFREKVPTSGIEGAKPRDRPRLCDVGDTLALGVSDFAANHRRSSTGGSPCDRAPPRNWVLVHIIL